MRLIIKNGIVVNEGQACRASVVVEDGFIKNVIREGDNTEACARLDGSSCDSEIDADGCYVLPGVIDSHVHFREPGLTAKADMESESRAAAYGGVTSFFDMPNTKPQTTTLEALEAKRQLAAGKSHVNYAFFIGATNDNIDTLKQVNPHEVPGVKLFMGASTGNMLVDQETALRRIFSEVELPVMTHCEDSAVINRNMEEAKRMWGDDPDVCYHPWIRSVEACYASTELAVSLARQYGTRLHVAHLTTERELNLFGVDSNITAEAVIAHLMFTDADYQTLGTRIKCNPAVKTAADRAALRRALTDGRIFTIGTDHAPHQLADKQGGCARAASGMPMLQFSLVAMLELVDDGVLTIERLVELMCHHPAQLFSIRDRGFVRPGCKADLVVVRRGEPWTVTDECVQSKCGWTPLAGHSFAWRVCQTVSNGHLIYNNGVFDEDSRGEALMFR